MSWFEQKVAAVLADPAVAGDPQHPPRARPCPRSSPAVIDILVDKFALEPIGDPAEDLCRRDGRGLMTEIADSPMETEVDSYDVVLVTNDGAESTIRCGFGDNGSRPLRGPAWC